MRIVLLLALVLAIPSWAQDTYPSRPVRLILPFPPGGPTDILGRLIAEKLSASLGQAIRHKKTRPGGAFLLNGRQITSGP